ncbi:hypothetical protein VF14_11360 [Nostoc linckia z18]|uniref:Uncharacterized protein n=2 Tax=Nostoc linckia TaxID=92942 RepID=A0A9Q5ZG59_NOSLI|nr:hypothetical protein VF02_13545 [Nostoc linckia z1]PHJ69789.1 hypothetical protein VF05_12760 [Nostoc linckia z3]PHJ75907.1 hypothetical protein VF03_09130 [Nostoc linckia z2]PHJ85592.1 hypothetical protein VF06_05015 [Nostoc linckia z4]PHJ88806.1 hypothetical protein VF07_14910 [Nostoc linckia z6]PHK00742.1 hypothetical protein VF04_02295 [Nostoc linckia z7]PHK06612.1 hypothetical protein VF08_03820 [Nostoc linckia z8]PHK10513.1 hypothetical protein VF09_10895 [Nostoc linckia z9]PHK2476
MREHLNKWVLNPLQNHKFDSQQSTVNTQQSTINNQLSTLIPPSKFFFKHFFWLSIEQIKSLQSQTCGKSIDFTEA